MTTNHSTAELTGTRRGATGIRYRAFGGGFRGCLRDFPAGFFDELVQRGGIQLLFKTLLRFFEDALHGLAQVARFFGLMLSTMQQVA